MVDVSPFFEPQNYPLNASAPNALATAISLNLSGTQAACVLRVPKTGNIRKIGFRTGSLTSPTDTDFRVETISAQFPTGTLWATNTNVVVASGSLTANAMNMATLTADAAVTIGDLIGLVFVPSGSPLMQLGPGAWSTSQLPYMAAYNAGWTANTGGPACAIEYDDGSYEFIHGVCPVSALNVHTYNSGSTPDEYALVCKFNGPARRCIGGWCGIDIDNDLTVVLYDTDGVTELATAALTSAARRTTAGSNTYPFYWSSGVTMQPNVQYFLSFRPGASSITMYSWDMLSAAALDQLSGGQNYSYATAKNPSGIGSWTITTTRRLIAGLLFDGIDVGGGLRMAGSGGLASGV